MCSPATCRACGKVTWSGCGQHVESVLRGVPKADRCSCTDAERAAASRGGLLRRLLGG